MAKGDSKRAQNQIDQQGALMQSRQDQLMNTLYPQQNQMFQNYNQGTGMNMGDYSGMMQNWQQFMQNPRNPSFTQFGGGGGGFYPSPGNGSASPQGGGGLINPSGMSTRDWVIAQGNAIGNQDIANNPDYWVNEINKVGGPGNGQYWMDKMINPGGGGGGFGGGFSGAGISPEAYQFYQGLVNNGGGFAWDPQFRGALGSAIGGYQDFANNGGFSPGDIQNLRARAVSPVRAAYQNAQNNISRARGLQGGFSPNYTAAQAKLTRNMAQGIGDANVDANASIAQMQQQGRLAGLAGLSGTAATGQGLGNAITGGNLNAQLAGAGGLSGLDLAGLQYGLQQQALQEQAQEANMSSRLAALSGMGNLYGTTPAMANMFGNQVLAGQGNLLTGNQQQQGLGSGLINSQINKSAIPGDFSQALGNIGGVLNLGGQIMGGLTGGFGMGNLLRRPGANVPAPGNISLSNPGNTSIRPAYSNVRF